MLDISNNNILIKLIFLYPMNPHNNNYTVENYLKALFTAADANGEVSTTVIAEQLRVSLPTVNAMVKRLHEMGYVEYEKYKPLRITAKCKTEAALIIRKHRLTEMFLVEKMGIGWEAVHEIAEQIEHINSPLFFERMDDLLGHPVIDPHGSPIPDKDGKIHTHSYKIMSECVAGETVELKALKTSSAPLLKYLNAKEIGLGTVFTIEAIEEFDQTIRVSYGNNKREVLSAQAVRELLVE
jgi:DtxR family Mn-dependent transcriptional regulator